MRARAGAWKAFIDGPSALRPGNVYLFHVVYGNSGSNDEAAPLLIISSPSGTAMGFAPDDLVPGERLQVLGISRNGPAGILKPGDQHQVPLFFSSSSPVNWS